jgi:glycosyltransferase involved in cell wall biosynthesis
MNSDSKKHIAVICNYKLHPNRIGGMDRFFIAYDEACKANGWTVRWFFSASEVHDFYSDLDVTSQHESVETGFLNHLDATQTNYDVVVTHFVELCTPFFKKIKRKTKAQLIAVDHNPRPVQGFGLKKRFKNKLKGLMYGKYIDIFVGVSQYTCKHLLKDYGFVIAPKIQLVYNGIDTRAVLKRKPLKGTSFIVASHLRESKGIQDLIAAVAALPGGLKNHMRIDIYGDGPYAGRLMELVKQNKLEHHFNFKGSSPALPKIFSNYAYMIQPTYMECFSLSILESLAANVPVITTTVGGNTEIIKDSENGYLYTAGDVKMLSNILEQILSETIGIYSDVYKEIEEEYTIGHMVANHLKLLK